MNIFLPYGVPRLNQGIRNNNWWISVHTIFVHQLRVELSYIRLRFICGCL